MNIVTKVGKISQIKDCIVRVESKPYIRIDAEALVIPQLHHKLIAQTHLIFHKPSY